jgi:hypothetical protein
MQIQRRVYIRKLIKQRPVANLLHNKGETNDKTKPELEYDPTQEYLNELKTLSFIFFHL